MTRYLSPLLLAALLGCSTLLTAAPAQTLTYQGTLGTAAGAPIDGARSITFRLYFAQDGAIAYWSETHNVSIDDGRFAVELGATTPLPNELFGEQLFLGIQVDGDVEMTPRLELTASPYAFRARSLMRGTIHVPADGTPAENGNALRAAIASAAAPAADNRYVISVDAGDFDLGTTSLVVPSHVSLSGAGPKATRLQAAVTGATVELSSNTGIASLGVLNTGAGGTFALPTSAVQLTALATDVAIDSVALASMPAGSTQGADVRAGVYFSRASRVVIDDVDVDVQRSQYVYGLRASAAPGAPAETGLVVRDTRIALSSANFVRGVDVSGRFDIAVDGLSVHATAGTIAATDTIGFRVQLETSLTASDLEIDMDYAASTPGMLRGIATNASANVDISNFRIDIGAGACDGTGFRDAIVAHNGAPDGVLLAQNAPQFRDGVIKLDTSDCFAGGVFSSGSAPLMDNLRIHVVSRGTANRGAFGYLQRSAADLCNGGYAMPTTANLRHSTITAQAESGFSAAVDSCIGDLAVEHTTMVGDGAGFRAGDNSVVSHSFRIVDSQMKGTTSSAVVSDGEANGRIYNSVFETPFTPVVAFPDAQTAGRSTIGCVASSTPTTFTATGCPCTMAPNCPSSP